MSYIVTLKLMVSMDSRKQNTPCYTNKEDVCLNIDVKKAKRVIFKRIYFYQTKIYILHSDPIQCCEISTKYYIVK